MTESSTTVASGVFPTCQFQTTTERKELFQCGLNASNHKVWIQMTGPESGVQKKTINGSRKSNLNTALVINHSAATDKTKAFVNEIMQKHLWFLEDFKQKEKWVCGYIVCGYIVWCMCVYIVCGYSRWSTRLQKGFLCHCPRKHFKLSEVCVN